MGNFSRNNSWSATAGNIVGGLNPIADARDIVAGAVHVYQGKPGARVELGMAMLGTIPVVGDALKAGRTILRETAEEAIERAVREGASELERIVDPLVREAAERNLREEAAQAFAKRELDVVTRMNELATQGHGPQRHGSHISEQQLDDRAVRGFDPVTGTRNDAYNTFPNGTPKPHAYGKDATKIVTDEAYTQAETYVRSSRHYNDALTNAVSKNDDRFAVEGVRLEDVFGANYKDQVFGKTRIGSKNNPQGSTLTDFTDGTITAIYRKDASGKWNLHTMYPEPKQ